MNYAGGELEIFRPIWLGDRISVQEQVGPVIRKESRRIGPFCICTGLVSYHNQRQELVATKRTLMARYKILDGGEGTIAYDRDNKADVQQESPDPLVWERDRRGAETRCWEDVTEGEEKPPLKKGAYTVNELYLFTFGVLGTRRSTRAALGGRIESNDHFDAAPRNAGACPASSISAPSGRAGWFRWPPTGWATMAR